MNDSRTNGSICAETVPNIRTLAELISFLHGYRIKKSGDEVAISLASIIHDGAKTLPEAIDADHAFRISASMLKAAKQLAERDPAMAWLPDWKPRVAAGSSNGS